MAITINSNADLPVCLNTEEKQIAKAEKLAETQRSLSVKTAKGVEIQGSYSRTYIVTFQDDTEVVVQFRPEPLDIAPFKTARQALGNVVPEIELLKDVELESEDIWSYSMTRMPGRNWLEAVKAEDPRAAVSINKSLGRILSQGYIECDSTDVVDKTIRPHLEKIVSSERSDIQPFKGVAQEFLLKLDNLKKLPLFISHFSLSQLNILVDESYQVSGIVDWELSTPLPFGMGFARIHSLAGEFIDREFHMPEDFEESERGFWEEVFGGMPSNIRSSLEANQEEIQMAVLLGKLLDTFHVEDGEIGNCNIAVLGALPKFLSYRIPLIRGLDPPYAK
jgi:hypothetical protein